MKDYSYAMPDGSEEIIDAIGDTCVKLFNPLVTTESVHYKIAMGLYLTSMEVFQSMMEPEHREEFRDITQRQLDEIQDFIAKKLPRFEKWTKDHINERD